MTPPEESFSRSPETTGPLKSKSPAFFSLRTIPVLMVLALGFLATFTIFQAFRAMEERTFRTSFELEVNERITALESSIQMAMDQVRGLKAFYDGSQRVEREEFRQFAGALMHDHSDTQALEWVPRVPAAWRRVYENAAHEDGLSGFQFMDPTERGEAVRAEERPEYYPVYFSAPQAANIEALGLDASRNPVLLQAMKEAQMKNDLSASAPLPLRRGETPEENALILFSPVYQKGIANPDEMKDHLMGFVAGVFRLEKLVGYVARLYEVSGIGITIRDVTDPSSPMVIYQSSQSALSGKPLQRLAHISRFSPAYKSHDQLNVAGRTWDVLCVPTSRYMANRLIRISWTLLVAGLIITALFGAYFHHMLRSGVKLKMLNAQLTGEIRERVRTEELRASEERYRGLVENAADPVLLIHRSGKIVDVNREACEGLGFTRAQLLEKNVWDVEPGCSPDRLDMLWQAFQAGGPVTVEAVFVRRDGGRFPVEIRAGALSLRGETYALFLARDITIRVRFEEDLRRTNAFLDSVIENIPDMIFIKDATDLRFIRFNKAGEELLGFGREELIGKNDYDFFPKEEADFFTAKDRDVVEHGQTMEISEEPIHTRRRGLRILHTKKIPIFSPEGKPLYLLGISEDVTDRKRAEERLRELSTAMEYAVEGIARLDAEGRFVNVNRSFAAHMGYALGELTGREWEQIVYDKDLEKARAAFDAMLKVSKSETEIRALRRDGSIFYQQAVMVKVHDTESRYAGSYLFTKDVTERKYRESVDLKSEMISVVAHELRTPLHAVREGISIMLDGLTGVLNVDQAEVLTTAKGSLDRLVRLVNTFLDFQRLEAGIVDFKLEPADLSAVIQEASVQVESLARSKKLAVELLLDPQFPKVSMDRDRIFQVLVNLINNGIKFTEKGGVQVSLTREEDMAHVSVRDTGIGIQEEDLPRLFRKFAQLESGQIAAPGGTGLGLAISRRIIEEHHGRLWVESQFGAGSTFHFTLPLEPLSGPAPAPDKLS